MNKIIIFSLLLLIAFFAGVWLFNHINAWLGIACIILTFLAAVNYGVKLFNQFNKNETKNN